MAMTGGTSVLVASATPPGWSGPMRLYVYWKQQSQSAAANETILSLGMYLTTPSGWYFGPWNDYKGSYIGTATSGDNCKTFSGACPANTQGTRWLAENQTITVPHDDDGKKTVTVYWQWGGASTWAGFSSPEAGSFTIDLTTIPRTSTIGATDANIGSVSTIIVSRKSTSFTHSVKYTFGSLSGYITADGTISDAEVKLTAANIAFKIPTSFYAQIPKAKTGICKLTCTTYSGDTQIGSAQTAQFTVTAAESLCGPTVSGTVVDVNDATIALTGDSSKLVRYYSDALCTITATAKNSASIAQKKIGGTVVTGNTRTIEGVETDTIAFTAADTRGYSAGAEVEFELIPYVKLTSNPAGQRTDPTSGKAVLSLKGNFYNGSFGEHSNALTLKYRIAQVGGSYGDYVTVNPSLSGNTYSARVDLSDLNYEYAFFVQVVASDKLASLTKTVRIEQGIPVFNWGKEFFRFNVPVKLSGSDTFEEDDAAATKGYVDGRFSMTLLWENASPTSSFAAQNVGGFIHDSIGEGMADPLADCDMILVLFRTGTVQDTYSSAVIRRGYKFRHVVTGSFKIQYRDITFSGSQIVFGSGQIIETYGSEATADDKYVIPRAIYMIKGEAIKQ